MMFPVTLRAKTVAGRTRFFSSLPDGGWIRVPVEELAGLGRKAGS
jgi:hypothetical protein